ncbi:TBC1 domain family member 13-like [Corticium candelabrum]|uniref:TBC1 domain family member 13-like n=1 Tax=Corticium candelabrum TaxID=121492 RepID=UPI002E258702|nr:TBC1 domain family member 13-like [Corticium candelabrum]
MAGSYKARVAEFDDFLKSDKFDVARLRQLAFGGVPEGKGRRSLVWKLLLSFLPLKRAEWASVLDKQRNSYDQFVQDLIVNPQAEDNVGDHPLSNDPDSQWSKFFKDNDVLLQIDKDCRRLLPDISFFQHPTGYPFKTGGMSLRTRVERTVLEAKQVGTSRGGTRNISVVQRSSVSEEYYVLAEGQEAHWEVVERILFIYAKLNPGVSYVQGMNEIAGPLYYVFASDPDPEWQKYAEPDTFYCFTSLMSEIRDNFIKTLDDSACGIGAMMVQMMLMLKEADFELWTALETKQLKPQFFAFRWLTLLLSQEFFLPDVIRFWDSLFADEQQFQFLIHVCCAMLIVIREQLLEDDFATSLKLLQRYPSVDVHQILEKAVELKEIMKVAADVTHSE